MAQTAQARPAASAASSQLPARPARPASGQKAAEARMGWDGWDGTRLKWLKFTEKIRFFHGLPIVLSFGNPTWLWKMDGLDTNFEDG